MFVATCHALGLLLMSLMLLGIAMGADVGSNTLPSLKDFALAPWRFTVYFFTVCFLLSR